MAAVTLLFLVCALGCFLFAAFYKPAPKIELVALGLALWVATQIPGLIH